MPEGRYFHGRGEHPGRREPGQDMNRKALVIGLAAAALLALYFLVLLGSLDGSQVFKREGCSNCHSFKGHGGEMAPDLTGVTHRRSTAWIKQQLRDPKSHNPNSPMPSFDHLSWWEVHAIIKYLNS
jgi:mono/diheme cytochrome c family protein